MRRDEDDDGTLGRPQRSDDLEPVRVRKSHVEERDVRAVLPDRGDTLGTRATLSDDTDLRMLGKAESQHVTSERLVIDDDGGGVARSGHVFFLDPSPALAGGRKGRRSDATVPVGVDVTSREASTPYWRSNRSRALASPTPCGADAVIPGPSSQTSMHNVPFSLRARTSIVDVRGSVNA